MKSLPWAFIVGGIRFATNSLTSNANLITKINCPRIVFPLSAVLSALFDMLIAVVPLIDHPGHRWRAPAAHSAVGAAAAAACWCFCVAGLGIAFSAANLFFRDVKYIVEVLLTFAIFFTPVFYSSELFGPWRDWMLLNPVAPLLEGLEQAWYRGACPTCRGWPTARLSAIVIFASHGSCFTGSSRRSRTTFDQ